MLRKCCHRLFAQFGQAQRVKQGVHQDTTDVINAYLKENYVSAKDYSLTPLVHFDQLLSIHFHAQIHVWMMTVGLKKGDELTSKTAGGYVISSDSVTTLHELAVKRSHLKPN